MKRGAKIATAGVIVLVVAAGAGAGVYHFKYNGWDSPVTGTETFAGTQVLTPAQAASNNFEPTIPVTASGLFSDRGSIYLAPGSGKNGDGPGPATIKLSKGDINVQHAANPDSNSQPVPVGAPSACVYRVTEHVGYTVTGGTGSYSNITGGKGVATVTFEITLPKVPSSGTGPGTCDTSNTAVPTGGSVDFTAVGPITRSS